jgi:hypothetical protein
MTEALLRYRELERRLWLARLRHAGEDSAEEEALLDDMEDAWAKLANEERLLLNSEGPVCWPMDSTPLPIDLSGSRLSKPRGWAYEGFRSGAEAIFPGEAA